MFVSIFYGTYDVEDNLFTSFYDLESKGLMLGVMPEAKYPQHEIELEADDFILMITDGVTDLRKQGDLDLCDVIKNLALWRRLIMNVNVQFREDGNVLRGYIEGEIDTFTAPILREGLETVRIVEGRNIELDLSKVNYMDNTGLGIFVAFYKKVIREKASLKLVNLSSRLVRLFDITGLSELMSIETDEKLELK